MVTKIKFGPHRPSNSKNTFLNKQMSTLFSRFPSSIHDVALTVYCQRFTILVGYSMCVLGNKKDNNGWYPLKWVRTMQWSSKGRRSAILFPFSVSFIWLLLIFLLLVQHLNYMAKPNDNAIYLEVDLNFNDVLVRHPCSYVGGEH